MILILLIKPIYPFAWMVLESYNWKEIIKSSFFYMMGEAVLNDRPKGRTIWKITNEKNKK